MVLWRGKKPETINYRTLKPERDGLFCERIFEGVFFQIGGSRIGYDIRSKVQHLFQKELKDELETRPVGQKRARILKRLEVVEAFRLSGNQPSWMIMDVVRSSRRTSVRWYSWTAADLPPAT